MPDPVPPQAKVEEAIADTLRAYDALEGWTVLTDVALDAPIEEALLPALVVRTMALSFDPSFEYGAPALNVCTIDVEALVKDPAVSIGRTAQAGLTHSRGALLADPTLGGMMQDLLEIDLAPGDGQRRDAGAISLQFRGEYHTDRDDPFTILGQAGAEF